MNKKEASYGYIGPKHLKPSREEQEKMFDELFEWVDKEREKKK